MADNAELMSGSESPNQTSNSPTEKRRKKELVKLDYFIHKYSSFSSNYVPENIMINNPYDQSSRWSTNSNTPPQFLTLRLNSPAIVKTITFGKYMKTHVCNLQKFCIMGGMDDTNMSELFTGGLKNDSVPETFPLRHHTKDGLLLPVAFVSIVPHLSWGSAFNYTIWYVELRGDAEYVLIRSALQTISLRKEEEAVRLCLKHLRRRRYRGAYEALARETGVRLEGATPARLWDALVEDGDYDRAEAIMDEAIREGQLKWYVSWQPYAPSWRLLSACSPSVAERLAGPGEADGVPTTPPPALPALLTYDRDWSDREPVATNLTEACDGCDSRPGPRGGHQLCVDSQAGALYLYGGWNGLQDLDDLWTYSIADEQWRLLCRHSEKLGGPSPRSCHKMVLDPVSGRIFTLGRYLDAAHRLPDNMKSDMYAYCVASNTWQLVCADTAAVGGPRLVFDHQMCIDADTGTIYVFGGRVLPASGEESGSSPQYSGLFAYHIRTNTWELLLPDSEQSLPARVGHSMLFHPTHRKLYIFAGQRNKEHLLDFVWFDVDTRRVGGAGSARGTTRPSPAAGFTQRATLDPDTDEIFVLSGLSKEKDRRVCNVLWVCSLARRTWSCIYRNDCKQLAQLPAHSHPCPRFAHQLVYDTVNKVHYLFGGNPGQTAHPRLRLDDFWSLRLARVSASALQRRLRAELRRARYEELAAGRQSVAALRYLQTRVHEAFDHEDGEQAEEYRKLATTLFTGGNASLIPTVPVNPSLIRKLRIRSRQVPQDWCADSESSLTGALAAVLGVEGGEVERDESPRCDARLDIDDVGLDESEPAAGPDYLAPDEARHWDLRQRRCELYDRLTEYFPRQCVPPKANLTDFVTL